MKHTAILILAALVGFINTLKADALVQFNNLVPFDSIDAPVYFETVGGEKLEGTGYYAQLWGGSSLLDLAPTAPIVNFRTGEFAGYVDVGLDQSREILGVLEGEVAFVQIRAWTSSSGDTWDTAIIDPLGHAGFSDVLQITTGGLFDPPVALVGLQSFAITPTAVPEPSTWICILLGSLVTFVAFRNQRA